MAEIKRFSNKTEITNGNTEDYLSLNDVLISQHVTGDNEDKKALLSTVKATIYGISTTAESTATKVVTLQNFPADFDLYVGFTVLVHFNNANKATTQLYLQIGSLDAQPATVHGQSLIGAFPAGTELEFTWTGSHFNTSDFAISALDTSNVLPLNSTAVNDALAEYQKTKYVSFDVKQSVVTMISDKSEIVDGKLKIHLFFNVTELISSYKWAFTLAGHQIDTDSVGFIYHRNTSGAVVNNIFYISNNSSLVLISTQLKLAVGQYEIIGEVTLSY